MSLFDQPSTLSAAAVGGALARGVERRADLSARLLGAARGTGGAGRPTLRRATAADGLPLAALARRDGQPVPGAPLLVAQWGDELVAAIGVLDRRVIAEPWAVDAGVADALQGAAAELRGGVRRARWAAAMRRLGRRATTADVAAGNAAA
ncbi:hypothetical protein [Patulibacter sp. SYSU D01012]|uniref:hypothetical protein n=1 Tax=Patulibacter sp. SYSU D01012 TaxID=2817381 RepID=UPI001B306588|nr:hypothetical protein [Patulibacter sp. SYSU D01012]